MPLSACNDRTTAPVGVPHWCTPSFSSRDGQAAQSLTGGWARFSADPSFRERTRARAFVDVGAYVNAGDVLADSIPAEQRLSFLPATAGLPWSPSRAWPGQVIGGPISSLSFTTRVAYDQAGGIAFGKYLDRQRSWKHPRGARHQSARRAAGCDYRAISRSVVQVAQSVFRWRRREPTPSSIS
jgi:hypothetical protein